MMKVPITPRSLTSSERAIIEKMLEKEFTGVSELRHQIDSVEVVAKWAAESVSVDLRVAGGVIAAPVPSGVVPVEATVTNTSGDLVGEILLWVESGMLSGLEYAWYGEEPPASLPAVDGLVIS